MDAEQASLSTIIIDSNGNPIGQVVYRCALCRKICDSSSDAMLHYQIDHIEFTKLHLQQTSSSSTSSSSSPYSSQQQTRTNVPGHSANATSNLSHRNNYNHNNNHTHHNNHLPSNSRQYSNLPSTSNAAAQQHVATGNILRRSAASAASSPGNQSLLKRQSSSTSSSSLLKKGPNVINNRSYQAISTANKRPANQISQSPSQSTNNINTIHRQYTTTSASRAAKRGSDNRVSLIAGDNKTRSANLTSPDKSRPLSSTRTSSTPSTASNQTASGDRSTRASVSNSNADKKPPPASVSPTEQPQASPTVEKPNQRAPTANTTTTSKNDEPVKPSMKTLTNDTSQTSAPPSSSSLTDADASQTVIDSTSEALKTSSPNDSITPNQKDSKSYSLRPRSERKLARIS